jgi:cyanophycinase
MPVTAGLLMLVGGTEFIAGNEPHDRRFVKAVGDGPAYVLATAAVRQDPDRAVATARRWFVGLGLEVRELRLRGRRDAKDPAVVEAARTGRGFYLCGGDPGLVVQLLSHTPAWDAVVEAWRDGAALAGSSAGAMALGEWTLIRAGMAHQRRRFAPALGLVPGIAVVPHFDEFGEGWLPSLRGRRPGATLIGIDVRTAAVWEPRRGWRAEGAGRVTVIRGDDRQEFAAGTRIRGLPGPGGVGVAAGEPGPSGPVVFGEPSEFTPGDH